MWMLATIVFMTAFAVFGYAGSVMGNPANVPAWLWYGTFTILVLFNLGAAMLSFWAALDELFLKKDDPHRITYRERNHHRRQKERRQ